MRRAALVAALALAGFGAACKHEPERVEQGASAAEDLSDVVPGELMVGTEEGVGPDAVLGSAAMEGYRAEYVAAASGTTHLIKVVRADGSALDAAATLELSKQLVSRGGLRFVELNRKRQPR